MPWWNPPEPNPKEPFVDLTEQESPTDLSEEGKRKAWRMLVLIDAFRARHEDPLSLDEIDQLGQVAAGDHDLHDASAALQNGCGLDHLVSIFT